MRTENEIDFMVNYFYNNFKMSVKISPEYLHTEKKPYKKTTVFEDKKEDEPESQNYEEWTEE